MSKYVLRSNGQNPVPPHDVVKLIEHGMGKSIAWFWNENEAREYINLHAAIAKKDAALRQALCWVGDDCPSVVRQIEEALK